MRQALTWQPARITSPQRLASECAKYCRMLRDAVSALPDDLLEHISADWRNLLFPDLSEAQFVDAYAQTVTFGLLTAGSLGIELSLDLDPAKCDRLNLLLYHISSELEKRRGLLGKSLNLLTVSAQIRNSLHAHLEVLLAVVGAVDWSNIRSAEANTDWLHFYEDFLALYDPALRKQSGSYYTPAGIVEWMTTFTDNLLESFLGADGGYSDEHVTVVDPALGTGTFLLSILDRINERVTARTGSGAVAGEARSAAAHRLIGFEIQSCPYAVSQLRLAGHLRSLGVGDGDEMTRVYLTDTLDDPQIENPEMPMFFEAISQSRAAANRVKRDETIVVALGNPPYLSGAGGQGGWVEKTLLGDWKPPTEWGVSAHAKELSNLYVYFWRWAAWKVFEDSRRDDGDRTGVVSFITTTGFLTGRGFEKMRLWLRQWCSDIWVLHLTPEGHQAPATSQIFEGMRQSVAVVTAVRARGTEASQPASVRYHMVPTGHRDDKLARIAPLVAPKHEAWENLPVPSSEAPDDWRAPFIAAPKGQWAEMARLEDLLPWHGNGVMTGRQWPISPDRTTLHDRWRELVNAPTPAVKRALFGEHRRDRRVDQPIQDNLRFPVVSRPTISQEPPVQRGATPAIDLIEYGHRSFDRQWIIHDKRLINRPKPKPLANAQRPADLLEGTRPAH